VKRLAAIDVDGSGLAVGALRGWVVGRDASENAFSNAARTLAS